MASWCFGWAGFQMLRFAQHDSGVGHGWLRGVLVGRDFRCFASLSMTVGLGVGDSLGFGRAEFQMLRVGMTG